MPGYKHCVTEGAADRQREFERALLELMGQKPLSQIAVKEICDRLGLSRKSFYRYFSSKDACLQALVDHAVLGFAAFAYPSDPTYPILESFFSYWLNQRPLLDVLCRNGLTNLLYERAMLLAAQEYGLRNVFLPDIGDYEQTIFFTSGAFGVLLSWYVDGCQKTPAQLAVSLSRLLSPRPQGVF